jgi:uncharacterized membrane protein YebE (DUF533 family)
MTLPAGSKKAQLKTTWRAFVLDRLRSPPAAMAHADRTEQETHALPHYLVSLLVVDDEWRQRTRTAHIMTVWLRESWPPCLTD